MLRLRGKAAYVCLDCDKRFHDRPLSKPIVED
jgi:hypothetical protein